MKNSIFVIDTNTLISAFLYKNSNPRKAFDKAAEIGKVRASIETFDEFKEVLLRPKFNKYISEKNKFLILQQLLNTIICSEILETITDCRDPKDNKFLKSAISANASCLITGDKDLLVLNPFRNIPIVNAVDFINLF